MNLTFQEGRDDLENINAPTQLIDTCMSIHNTCTVML